MSVSGNGQADAAPQLPRTDSGESGDSLASAICLMLLLTVLQRGTGFFRNVMVCRLLEPVDLGYWNLAHSLLILAAPLIVLGIPGTFKRYLAYYHQRGQLREFLWRTTRTTALLTGLGLALMIVFHRQVGWLAFGDADLKGFVIGVTVTLLFVIGFNYCVELLTSLRQVKALSYLQLANTVIFTAVSLGLIVVGRLGVGGVIAGYAVACAVTSCAALVLILRTLRRMSPDTVPGQRTPLWGKLISFAFWFWAADLVTNLFGVVDRLMIVHLADDYGFDGLALVGQYHSSQIIGVLLVALTAMFGGVLLSYVSHDWETGNRARAEQTLDSSLRLVALALTVAAAIGLLVAPGIFHWALDDKYTEGFRVLPLTMAYCIWFGLLGLAQNYIWCRERAWLASATVLVGLVANAALNYLWMPRWGLSGAVAATAVANLLTLLSLLYVSYLLGMRYRLSTVWATLAPATLCLGGGPALGLSMAVIAWGLTGGWLLTLDQRDRLDQQWQRWRRRRKYRSVVDSPTGPA